MDLQVIKTRFEERMKAANELRALAEKAGDREFTGEEKQVEERCNNDLDRLDVQIKKAIEEAEREQRANDALGRYDRLINQPAPQINAKLQTEFRSLANKQLPYVDISIPAQVLLSGRLERRDLTIAPAASVPVPRDFAAVLYQALQDTSTIRLANPTVFQTSSGNTMDVPRALAHGNVAFLAEAATLAENDPTLTSISLGAFKVGSLIQVSRELLEDTGFDIVTYLAGISGENIAIVTDAAYVTGSGTGQPTGLIGGATVGVTLATGNTTNFPATNPADSLIDLYHSVSPRYRARGSWLANDLTTAKVRKFKDSTGQYLWQPALVAGQPDTFLSRPWISHPAVAVQAANSKSVAFGDFRGYAIRDVNTVRFERSDEFAWSSDLVSFRAVWRTDGKTLDTAAIKVMQQSAT